MGTINMLWYIALYFLYAVPIIHGISDLSLNFAADYFKGIATTNLCFLTCGNRNWHTKFVKQTYMKKLKVSNVYIDEVGINQTVELKACLKHYFTPIGVLIDPKCTQFENIMLQVSTEELFDTYHKWLIIEENTSNTSIKDIKASMRLENTDNFGKIYLSSAVILHSLNLSIDAEIAVATTKDFSTYNIYEVFNFGKIRGGKFVIHSMGDWNIRTGLNLTKIYKYYRRWDFQQMALKMIIVIQPIPKVFDPEMILGRIPGPGVSILQQTSAQILHELADVHNLKYDIIVVDRWVGDYNRKHKNAVTNSLYFRESDVGPMLRLLPAHFDRYDILHPPVTYVDIRYFYKIPTKGIGKFENQFLRPLSFGSWWGVILISALCGLVLLLSAVVEERPISADFAVCSVLALICQQFFEEFEDLKRISSARKLTTLVTGLSCLLVYNYYTSSVVSWLLNGPPPTINSLWELLDSSLTPVFEDIGYTRSWLQLSDYYFNKKCPKAEDELKRRLIIMQKKGINIVATINEGIDLVKRGGYVFHAELHAAYDKISQTFTKSELCELGSLASMEKTLLYSAVPKRSAFREFFIWGLSHINERGIINIVQLRTWPQVVKCEGSSPQALALGGAAPAFIILAAGFVLAIFIMLLERMKWKFDTARANNRTIFKINK